MRRVGLLEPYDFMSVCNLRAMHFLKVSASELGWSWKEMAAGADEWRIRGSVEWSSFKLRRELCKLHGTLTREDVSVWQLSPLLFKKMWQLENFAGELFHVCKFIRFPGFCLNRRILTGWMICDVFFYWVHNFTITSSKKYRKVSLSSRTNLIHSLNSRDTRTILVILQIYSRLGFLLMFQRLSSNVKYFKESFFVSSLCFVACL